MAEHSALRWLHEYGRRYPGAWQAYADLLAEPPMAWPSWCFCPLAGAYAVLSEGGRLLPTEVAQLGGIAAWRATQGIYRVYPTLLEELLGTPIDGDIPGEMLFRLPEWCVYVELPNAAPLAGFFAYLEYDAGNGHAELRILLDCLEPRALVPLIVHLGLGSIRAGIEAANLFAVENVRDQGNAAVAALQDIHSRTTPAALSLLERLVSVLLYLCADEADVPARLVLPPRVVRGKKRALLPTPKHGLSVHHCGIRVGAQLDLARAQYAERAQGSGVAVQPHIRRAHWHTFWRGPRDGERTTVVRWLPPIAVNLDGSPEIAVVRPVGRDIEA